MQVGDLVEIRKAWKSLYPCYSTMVALVIDTDCGWNGERPLGFRRIRLMHGNIDGEIYSVFAEEVLEVVCSK